MPLADLLTAEHIVILTGTSDRDGVLDAAARLLCDGSPLQTSIIADALRRREDIGSTGIGRGVAIPHARSKSLQTAKAAFLRLRHPVPFGASDDVPVDLVLAMSVPEHSTSRHLEILSEIADRFASHDFRDSLRGARNVTALRKVLLDLPRATMSMSA